MADITMCEGDHCPVKDNCYRYTAPVNEYMQSYFVVTPWDTQGMKCSMYWPLEIKKVQDEARSTA